MLNDTEMESCSIVALALELNTFVRCRRNTCDYKLWNYGKLIKVLCIGRESLTHRWQTSTETWKIYLYKTLAHRSNLRSDRNHRNTCLGVDTGWTICTGTRIFCMTEPARWNLIIKRHKRLYHIGWSGKWWKTNYKEKKLFRYWYKLRENQLNGACTHNYKLIINYYDYSINFTRLHAF